MVASSNRLRPMGTAVFISADDKLDFTEPHPPEEHESVSHPDASADRWTVKASTGVGIDGWRSVHDADVRGRCDGKRGSNIGHAGEVARKILARSGRGGPRVELKLAGSAVIGRIHHGG